MMERSEGALPPMHLWAGWGLNLTVSRRILLLRCQLLRHATPFLAMGGRYSPQTASARSVGLLTSMPWLAPRWLEWQERIASPAHTDKQNMPLPMAAAPTVVPSPVRSHSQQQTQPLIALALFSPFSRNQRTPASPPPAPAVYLERTKGETSDTGMGALQKPRIKPQVLSYHVGTARQADGLSALEADAAERQNLAGPGGEGTGYPRGYGRLYGPMPPGLQKMALLWGPLAGFRGLAPGISPAAPEHRTEHLFRSPPAAGTRELPLLPQRRLHVGLETAAPGPVSPAGAGGEGAGYQRGSGSLYGPMPPGLQKMALLWDSVAGFRGLASGTSPAAPEHRTEHLFRSPPAAGTRELPPLPERRLHVGLETAAPGQVSPQGLSLLLETIGHTMKREVAAAIREREEKAQQFASNRSSGLDMTTAEDLVSDDFIRLFMKKMRKQAEEERFRLGLLR